jgi:hypothetical protein
VSATRWLRCKPALHASAFKISQEHWVDRQTRLTRRGVVSQIRVPLDSVTEVVEQLVARGEAWEVIAANYGEAGRHNCSRQF